MPGYKKMDVPQPVYDWLLTFRTELRIARSRNVTWPEVFEHLMQQYEVNAQAARHAKADCR